MISVDLPGCCKLDFQFSALRGKDTGADKIVKYNSSVGPDSTSVLGFDK